MTGYSFREVGGFCGGGGGGSSCPLSRPALQSEGRDTSQPSGVPIRGEVFSLLGRHRPALRNPRSEEGETVLLSVVPTGDVGPPRQRWTGMLKWGSWAEQLEFGRLSGGKVPANALLVQISVVYKVLSLQ